MEIIYLFQTKSQTTLLCVETAIFTDNPLPLLMDVHSIEIVQFENLGTPFEEENNP